MAKNNSKVENLSNSNLFIVLLLITLLVLGVSALLTKSLVTGIIRDTKIASADKAADDQLKKDLEAAPSLVSAHKALGTSSDVLANALPNTVDFPSLIVMLENMTNDAGVNLKSVSPSINSGTGDTAGAGTETTTTGATAATSSTTPSPQAYPFSVTLDGTYDSLVKFLGNLEMSARPVRVVGLQLNGSGSSLSGQLDLNTYYQDKATLPFSKETIK